MAEKLNKMKVLTNGFIAQNPTYVQVLGMCPTLATTTSDVMTGATITPRAVVTSINAMYEFLKKAGVN